MLSRTNALNHPSISSVLSSAGGSGTTHGMAPTSRPTTSPVKPKPPTQPHPQPGPAEKPRGRAQRTERPPCRRDPFMQTIDYRSFDPCELRHRLTTLDTSGVTSSTSSSHMDKESKSTSLAVSRVHSLSRANSIGTQARAYAAARNHQRPRKPLSDCILASLFGWTSLLRPRKKQQLALPATTSLSITAA